jgi:hypothetical protein
MTDPTPISAPIVEDPPQPHLDELQQREVFDGPTVPVRIDGPADVHTLPSKRFNVSQEFIGGSNLVATRILTQDPTRRRAIVILRSATATDAFLVQSTSSGQGVAWPANVALTFEHCDEVFAKMNAADTSATLSIMTEHWAD